MLAAADPYQRSLSMHPAVLRLDTRDAWPEPWFRFAMLQQGHLVNNTGALLAQLRAAVSAAQGMPVVNSEANYVRQHTLSIRRAIRLANPQRITISGGFRAALERQREISELELVEGRGAELLRVRLPVELIFRASVSPRCLPLQV